VSVDGAALTERCDQTGCGPASVLVRVHPGPSVVSFSADAPEIETGGGTTLRWDVSLADQVVIAWVDATGSHEQPFGPAQREMLVTPADSTRYTLVARGGGKTASRQLVLGVRPSIDRLSGPNNVFPGEVFDLSWSTSGATLVELEVGGKRVPLVGVPASEGSVTVQADPTLQPGSSLLVLLYAKDDETPRRIGQKSLQILVE
jgi:hypothetical protein